MLDRRSTLLAGSALIVGVAVAALMPQWIGHAWLAAMFFWSGVPVGSIGLLLIMQLIGGTWRERLGPPATDGARALPVLALAVLPVLLGLGTLYPWAGETLSGFKGAWLGPGPFVLRTIVWLAGLALTLLALRRSPGRAAAVASAGLLFLVPWGSLAAVDWLMSLDPEFHSSGFGLQALSIQFTVAVMIAAIRAIRVAPDPSGTVGALMLTMLLLWAYFAYLPFFVIWSGNAPAGAAWYLRRARDGWGWVAGAGLLLHVAPLLALLSGTMRRSTPALLACAGASLIGDALQSAWLVLPQVDAPSWLPAAAFVPALFMIGAPTLIVGRRP